MTLHSVIGYSVGTFSKNKKKKSLKFATINKPDSLFALFTTSSITDAQMFIIIGRYISHMLALSMMYLAKKRKRQKKVKPVK